MGRKKTNGTELKNIAKRNAEILNMLGKKTNISRKLNVTGQTLTNYSKGTSATFTPEYLLRLYKYYSVNPMYILTGTGDKFLDKVTAEHHYKIFDEKLNVIINKLETLEDSIKKI